MPPVAAGQPYRGRYLMGSSLHNHHILDAKLHVCKVCSAAVVLAYQSGASVPTKVPASSHRSTMQAVSQEVKLHRHAQLGGTAPQHF